MKKGPTVVTVSLLFSMMLVLPAIALSAGRGQRSPGGVGAMSHATPMGRAGFGGHIGVSRGFGGNHVAHRGFDSRFAFGHPFHHDHRFGRFFPFAFAAPVWWFGWPSSYGWPYFYGSALSPDSSAYYDGSAAYRTPYPPASAPAGAAPTVYSVNIYNPAPAAAQPSVQPAVYTPPSAMLMTPATPASPQDVVEYEGGRYELRGDGIAMAYRWVWIPNPPPGPPGASSMTTPSSGELAPARRGTLYRWVDDQGALHLTDRWQSVPLRYREQAKQNLSS